jgi:hypothetical protein
VPDTSLDIDELLMGLGFDTPEGRSRARALLETERLTRAGKSRIDGTKVERVEGLLSERLFVCCGAANCLRLAAGRAVVSCAQVRSCQGCGGSANRRSVEAAQAAFQRASIRHVVIVGGSPAVHEEILRLKSDAWELRLIDGKAKRTLDQARADARWSDLVLIWGATELDHKVSGLYLAEVPRDRLVMTARRGVAALFDEAATHASRR